jgi:hypothetical protein
MTIHSIFDKKRKEEIRAMYKRKKNPFKEKKASAERTANRVLEGDFDDQTYVGPLPFSDEEVKKRFDELEKQIDSPDHSEIITDPNGAILKMKGRFNFDLSKLVDIAFIDAVEKGDVERVKELIKKGANVNADDSILHTSDDSSCSVPRSAYDIALSKGHGEIAAILRKHGAKRWGE